MNTQDLVVGKLYTDDMFPEQTFVYRGKGTLFTKEYDFDCAELGCSAGILCTEAQVLRDITPLTEVNS
jgi:hypothetical protein